MDLFKLALNGFFSVDDTLNDKNKLHLESEKSIFYLYCINASEFPLKDENFNI